MLWAFSFKKNNLEYYSIVDNRFRVSMGRPDTRGLDQFPRQEV